MAFSNDVVDSQLASTGKPSSGVTINRYVSQANRIYKYAKRLKLLPRGSANRFSRQRGNWQENEPLPS